jgi:hypothetical protein
MTDEELRALVRDAIARHLGGGGTPHAPGELLASGARPDPPWRAHASFARFLNLPADATSGPCLIEPNVPCNHCGYCKSYGH